MQPEQFSSEINTHRPLMSLKQFRILSGLGMLGFSFTVGSLSAMAQVEVQIEAPAAPIESPTPVEAAPPPAPVETSAESLLKPQVTAIPTAEPVAAPSAPVIQPAPAPAAESSAPAPTVRVETAEPERLNNVLIDPTDYSLGATPSRDTPSLIFSDRTTGCQLTLRHGQSVPVRNCGDSATASAGSSSAGNRGGSFSNGETVVYGSPTDQEGAQFSVGPVSIGGNGVTFGNTTVISREYFNEKLRSLNLIRRGAEEFVFPLAVPSPISSLFGWRVHPIFGDRRFHTGTDLAAPEGTPVVATQDGEVHVADYLGGYGLTVILRHAEGSLETRYAHLSRILVRPGEKVQQGEVVGLVGSTGNSTGPHLHFELRELTAQGWILLDPDELIQYAAANLAEVMNKPLYALGLAENKAAEAQEGQQTMPKELPYRPAQPNAN